MFELSQFAVICSDLVFLTYDPAIIVWLIVITISLFGVVIFGQVPFIRHPRALLWFVPMVLFNVITSALIFNADSYLSKTFLLIAIPVQVAFLAKYLERYYVTEKNQKLSKFFKYMYWAQMPVIALSFVTTVYVSFQVLTCI